MQRFGKQFINSFRNQESQLKLTAYLHCLHNGSSLEMALWKNRKVWRANTVVLSSHRWIAFSTVDVFCKRLSSLETLIGSFVFLEKEWRFVSPKIGILIPKYCLVVWLLRLLVQPHHFWDVSWLAFQRLTMRHLSKKVFGLINQPSVLNFLSKWSAWTLRCLRCLLYTRGWSNQVLLPNVL